MDRRKFITGTAAASGIMLLKPKTAFGYQANSAVRYALLGCGNRGTAVATSFAKNTSARIVAIADLFPDQLEKGKAHFDDLNKSLGYAGPAPVPRLQSFRRTRRLKRRRRRANLNAALLPRPASRSHGQRRQARLLRKAHRHRHRAD